jgi:hypothetical protein
VSAGQVADELWPDGRRSNSRGQVMHVGAGVAGRMLRRSRAVAEVAPKRWEIVPEYLEQPNA